MIILLAALFILSSINAELSLMYLWCIFQTVPQVDDEGYSIRPENPTQSILDIASGSNIGKLTSD